MCVAIVKPANVDFPKELFEMAWRKNPHGGGYMYAKDGKVIVRKGFMTLEGMMQDYDANQPYFEDSPVVLHFRIRTHGPVAPEQTHPHTVNDRLAFVHNGMINIQIPSGSANSDTMEFNERVLKHLPEGFTKSAEIMELIRGYVDPSRLVFLDGDKNVVIVNEKSGSVDSQGRWHSNEGALAAVEPQYQSDTFYEIVDKRQDPDITKWQGLSKKAKKALRKKQKHKAKLGAQTCAMCERELSSWEAEEGSGCCFSCAEQCSACGNYLDPSLIKTGVGICYKCMTEEERKEVEALISGDTEFYADRKDVANKMIDAILNLESGWEQYAFELSPADRTLLFEYALKSSASVMNWLHTFGDQQNSYSIAQDIRSSPRGAISQTFDDGYESLLSEADESFPDEWESNPPKRLYLVS